MSKFSKEDKVIGSFPIKNSFKLFLTVIGRTCNALQIVWYVAI